jgi:hypothetical protein
MMQNNERGKDCVFSGLSLYPRGRCDVGALVMMGDGIDGSGNQYE